MRPSTILYRTLVAAALLLGLAGSAGAQAPNNPVGLWRLQAYNDNTPAMAVMGAQDVCFLANGTWFGTTFPGWGGRWFQKGNNLAGNGDRVRIAGNYAAGVGNDSAELDFVNVRLMTGPWTEWRNAFPFLLWARLTATRIGVCQGPGPLPLRAATAADDEDDGRNPIDSLVTPQ
jgi:hypothetical protein